MYPATPVLDCNLFTKDVSGSDFTKASIIFELTSASTPASLNLDITCDTNAVGGALSKDRELSMSSSSISTDSKSPVSSWSITVFEAPSLLINL